ncbi:saccharopine dehydrogenase [Uncinocarpus reesii 1704]|uniref:Saccharopine dehydrogenase n=1 Tax=Uncinocarpus reesii (strain UAMH 1704) TaxID=336963 RepID=C4JS36_UNCRE|nr:saccharopine dehydrogenase [Uncinocarpus reesii 1704]EEP80433.1 saccharopine dehydrogenase [Uncinocarpus reesii 1704]
MSSSMHLSKMRKWFASSPPVEWGIGYLRELLIGAIKQGPIPQHVAFVMDGNRRFARNHAIERVEGHNLGFEALAKILEVCYKAGVKVVTIYAFSIENFKRSKFEVDALMEMAKVKLSQLSQHGDLLDRYGASVRVLGRRELVKADVLEAIDRAVEVTSRNGDAILNICFPYTSRDEITSAIRNTVIDYSTPLDRSSSTGAKRQFSKSRIAQTIREQTPSAEPNYTEMNLTGEEADAVAQDAESPSSFSSTTTLQQLPTVTKPATVSGPYTSYPPNSDQLIFLSPETISTQTLEEHMLTAGSPPLDVLVRTPGVERLSDFMLWQCSPGHRDHIFRIRFGRHSDSWGFPTSHLGSGNGAFRKQGRRLGDDNFSEIIYPFRYRRNLAMLTHLSVAVKIRARGNYQQSGGQLDLQFSTSSIQLLFNIVTVLSPTAGSIANKTCLSLTKVARCCFTKPTVEILSDAGIQVTVACRTLESAKKLCQGIKNTNPISLDVNNSEALDAELSKNDLVVSLIPYTYHATVIKGAIRTKKNVVTTSYVSPAMLELEKEAKEAGITVMNEIGLDPGIDHLYAVKTISEVGSFRKVHAAGGKITSFLSYCGGLPAPECSNNPLGYKFSWSSRGVLLALRNDAKYYKDGKIEAVSGPELMGTAKPYFIYPGFAFVAYPNRDSTMYKERYNIPEAQTVIRGTLRFQGFPEMIHVLVDIGFLSDEPRDFLKSPIPWEGSHQANSRCYIHRREGSCMGHLLQDSIPIHRGEKPHPCRSSLDWPILR